MWDFFETVRHRHSIRKYQPDMPVEPEKLHAILEMACAAPIGGRFAVLPHLCGARPGRTASAGPSLP
jgi:nitroreductase